MFPRNLQCSAGVAIILPALFGLVAFSATGGEPVRPNVLFIVSEDNGPELGCYGTPDVRTPNLDRLAAEGCRFANAYVTHAVCSASRASFLTGLFPFQNGQIGLATHRYSMFQNWDNIPSILKEHGYRTGMVGKLHVNPESAFPLDYRAIPGSGFNDRPMRKYADAAAEFITASDQAFFLAVNFPDAHFPLLRQQHGLPEHPFSGDHLKPLPFIGVDTPRLRQGAADYYNCLMRLDAGVGMLLEELDKAGKAYRTLVIYISDHGAQFSRGKATCYEGGLRIPMIVRWPGQVKPDTVRNELVSTIDIVPTVIQAAGLPARASLPGRSLLPLTADRDVPWREYLFAERTAYHAASFFPQRTVRDERYKLILNLTPERANPVAQTYRTMQAGFFLYGTNQHEIQSAPKPVQEAYATWRNPPPVELYDLQNDPWEFRNLSDKPELADVKERLLDELRRFRHEHDDPLLDPAKLEKLSAEHDHVAENDKGGRYGKGQSWKYLEYLKGGKDSND
jgi:N-sulfoglucosamine sulfohydrolase